MATRLIAKLWVTHSTPHKIIQSHKIKTQAPQPSSWSVPQNKPKHPHSNPAPGKTQLFMTFGKVKTVGIYWIARGRVFPRATEKAHFLSHLYGNI